LIAALAFAWQHSREVRADIDDSVPGQKTYTPHGTLFFASTTHFQALFDPQNDPQQVVVNCQYLHLVDHSAIAALESLAGRYEKFGKGFTLHRLSPRNHSLLDRAGVAIAIG